MEYAAHFQRNRAVRQRQRKVKVMVHDHDGQLIAQPVEAAEQLFDHGRGQAFEGFVQQQQLGSAFGAVSVIGR